MKVISILVLILAFIACGPTKEISHSTSADYKMEQLNIVKNGFEGNIVIEVYDKQMNPIYDYQSILTENGKVIFDVPQKGHRCTFFKDGKNLAVEIRKAGYKTIKTFPFTPDEEMEMASFIKITLEKE